MKKLKRLSFICAAVFLLVCFGGILSSCATKEESNYYLELEIKPYGKSDIYHLNGGEKQSFSINMGLETGCELGCYLKFNVINKKTKTKEFSFINQNYDKSGKCEIKEYKVFQEEKEITKIWEPSLEEYSANILLGYTRLAKTAGIHKIKILTYGLPAYGIDEETFEITFEVEKDERNSAVEIFLDETSEYEKINLDSVDNKENYDIYKCKKLPVFGSMLKENGKVLQNDLVVRFRKLDKDYNLNMPVERIESSGIYLCQVYYNGSEEYSAVNYFCYIII